MHVGPEIRLGGLTDPLDLRKLLPPRFARGPRADPRASPSQKEKTGGRGQVLIAMLLEREGLRPADVGLAVNRPAQNAALRAAAARGLAVAVGLSWGLREGGQLWAESAGMESDTCACVQDIWHPAERHRLRRDGLLRGPGAWLCASSLVSLVFRTTRMRSAVRRVAIQPMRGVGRMSHSVVCKACA